MATVPTFADGGVLHAQDLSFLGDQPGGGAYRAAVPSIATSSTTVITWDTLWFDRDPTMWASGTQLTINTPGTFLIKANVRWAANANGYRFLDVRKNSAGSGAGGTDLFADTRPAATGTGTIQSISDEIPGFVAGDYIEVFVAQSSGGPLSLSAGSIAGCVSLSVRRTGA